MWLFVGCLRQMEVSFYIYCLCSEHWAVQAHAGCINGREPWPSHVPCRQHCLNIYNYTITGDTTRKIIRTHTVSLLKPSGNFTYYPV
jgi:hypothetical protein